MKWLVEPIGMLVGNSVLLEEKREVQKMRFGSILSWLLGSSVQKQARRDGERSPSLVCKHRKVGVESDVVDRILMHERRYSHGMEKLFVWLV